MAARSLGACSGPVRSECIQNAFKKTPGPLDREPDHRSGSPQGINLGLNHGQVRLGSGSNQGSEPNLTIPTLPTKFYDASQNTIFTSNQKNVLLIKPLSNTLELLSLQETYAWTPLRYKASRNGHAPPRLKKSSHSSVFATSIDALFTITPRSHILCSS
jgi:hypothetical protein